MTPPTASPQELLVGIGFEEAEPDSAKCLSQSSGPATFARDWWQEPHPKSHPTFSHSRSQSAPGAQRTLTHQHTNENWAQRIQQLSIQPRTLGTPDQAPLLPPKYLRSPARLSPPLFPCPHLCPRCHHQNPLPGHTSCRTQASPAWLKLPVTQSHTIKLWW